MRVLKNPLSVIASHALSVTKQSFFNHFAEIATSSALGGLLAMTWRGLFQSSFNINTEEIGFKGFSLLRGEIPASCPHPFFAKKYSPSISDHQLLENLSGNGLPGFLRASGRS